jgi:spore germination protein D
MVKLKSLLIPCCFLVLIGCAPKEQGNGQIDYEQTKKMVVDILKTDEGKKAIEEIMADDKMQQKFIMDQAIVSQSVESTLISDKGTDFWKKSFDEPKFVESFAKSMQSEHEQLIKDLMKDPDYQKMMIDILKDPEMEKEMVTVLKSQEFRKHLQTVMSETFESPLFKAKIESILIKAAEEMQSGDKKEEKKEDEGGGSEA